MCCELEQQKKIYRPTDPLNFSTVGLRETDNFLRTALTEYLSCGIPSFTDEPSIQDVDYSFMVVVLVWMKPIKAHIKPIASSKDEYLT